MARSEPPVPESVTSGHLMSPWFRPDEAAWYLRTTVAAVYKLAQRGRIKVSRLGRHYRFHRKDLDAYLSRRTS